MRTIPIAAAFAALLGAAAMAQTMSSTPPATTPPATPPSGTGPAQMHRAPATNPLTQANVTKIQGTDVYGSDNKDIGHISDILMNPQTKKIDRLVVSVGGVLGVGGRRVALPISRFSWDGSAGGGAGAFKLSENAASLAAMPEWRDNNGTGTRNGG